MNNLLGPSLPGRTFQVFGGDIITLRVVGDESGGAYLILDTTTPAGMGPPPHIHHREDESFFVLEGEFEFVVGGQAKRAKPGDFLTAPKDVPHFFRNVGQTAGRMIIICRPAGFEHFVREFAEIPVDQPPDVPRMIAIGQRHGLEFVLGAPT